MKLTPVGGDPRRDITPTRTGGGVPTGSPVVSNEATPQDTWVATTAAAPQPDAAAPGIESSPPRLDPIHGQPIPSPGNGPGPAGLLGTEGNNPSLLMDGDLLSRPLTLEELQSGRLLEPLPGEQPATAPPSSPLAMLAASQPPAAETVPKAAAPVAPAASEKVDAASLTHIVPPKDEAGVAGTVAASSVRAARRLGNLFMSVVGKGDDTLDMQPALATINALEPQVKAMSDTQLKGMTQVFKSRLAAGESLDSMLPEAFAVVREAAFRSSGMRPFDVQVLGGIAMHEGKIAEMGTGEGKTITATMPVYLNAITGKGVHVVTVNDTLAQRDCANMGKIYGWMGLTSGVVTEGMSPEQKREGYAADITYVTNTTLGFDYLRDNMARSKEDVSQREPHFALIDEVDEILIDEARTPLIISQLSQPSEKEYETFAAIVKDLVPGEDFKVSLKDRQTWLTDEGMAKVEGQLGVGNLYDDANVGKVHYLEASLKARTLFVRDKDYVVANGKVEIVDEFTGRIMDGRRYNDGIHQALEAKEGVAVQPEQHTMASITYPNLFRRYQKVAGMSGTAKTEEGEFQQLYGLSVAVIPPNRPSQRVDQPDLVYRSYQEKFNAVADNVAKLYNEGKPVLIATRNVAINEYLDKLLNARGVPHQLLNARSVKDNTQAENDIIALAGKSGMVTLATNMAGRGVDIKPDSVNFKQLTGVVAGNLQQGSRVAVILRKPKEAEDLKLWLGANGVALGDSAPTLSEAAAGKTPLFQPLPPAEAEGQAVPVGVQVIIDDRAPEDAGKPLPSLGQGVVTLDATSSEFATGGLHVVGTERHESRRIDNQLKGRSARQGAPGETQFFVSLDDELMRLFGGDKLKSLFDRMGIKPNQAVQDRMLDKAIESAQKRVEGMHFDQRTQTTKYDGVMNLQREAFYKDRKAIVDREDLTDVVKGFAETAVDEGLKDKGLDGRKCRVDQGTQLWSELCNAYALEPTPLPASLAGHPTDEKVPVAKVREEMVGRLRERLEAQENTIGSANWKEFLRELTLNSLDQGWFVHLSDMEDLQQGIGLVAYGQQDPWMAYQKSAHEQWEGLQKGVRTQVLREAVGSRFVMNPPS